MSQAGHLGVCYPKLPVVSRPGRMLSLQSLPPFVPHAAAPSMSEAIVQLSAGPSQQLRQEGEAEAAGRGCSPCSLPGCQNQSSQVRVARSCWHGLALTLSPFQWPGLLCGEAGGAGQPAAGSGNFPLPEPAAGCHLGRGSASFPNLPSLWKRGGKLCAEKIASPPS